MTPNDLCPTVFVGLTPFGDDVGRALRADVVERCGSVPEHLQFLPSSIDPVACWPAALGAALNARNRLWLEGDGARRAVWVVLAASAFELADMAGLRARVAALRRRFQAARIPGSVALLIHVVGGDGEALPAPGLLEQIDELRDVEVVFHVSDYDARGRFQGAADLVNSTGRVLLHFLGSPRVRERVLRRRTGAEPCRIACGIGGVDLNADRLRAHLSRVLRDRIVEQLFQTAQAGELPEIVAPLSDELLSSLLRSGEGGLAAIDGALAPAADGAARRLAAARLEAAARSTRQALLGQLPAPLIVPPTWWQRVRQWLRQWVFRASRAPRAAADGRRSTGLPVDRMSADVVEIERFRLALNALRWDDAAAVEETSPPIPFQFAAAAQPAVRSAFEGRLPDVQPIVRQLLRKLSEQGVSAARAQLAGLKSTIAEHCRAALCDVQQLRPEDCFDLFQKAADLIAPQFPGPGVVTDGIALLPPGLPPKFRLAEFTVADGDGQELALLVVRSGVRCAALYHEEKLNHDSDRSSQVAAGQPAA